MANLSENAIELRWHALLRASVLVYDAFKSGHHPTEYALDRLRAAIDGVSALKICGHTIIEDCHCFDGGKEHLLDYVHRYAPDPLTERWLTARIHSVQDDLPEAP